jgi:hypothetical protein
MATEDAVAEGLRFAAARVYGEQRADELAKRLGEIAHWLALVGQQRLDLLDEEPDGSGR